MSVRNSNGKALNERVQRHSDGSKEYWRDVPRFKGKYRVSDWGRVKSLPRKKWNGQGWQDQPGAILKLFKSGKKNKQGQYLFVMLCKNAKYTSKYVHRLVLEVFVSPCPPGMEACHDPDRDRANNHLTNLRWDTHKENVQDAVKHGTLVGARGKNLGEAHFRAAFKNKDVLRIRHLYGLGERTRMELATEYQVGWSTINSIVKRRTWMHI
jgi:hypothetical protein